MYSISVETEFCAAHAIDIAGVREPLHGHNWRVTATISGDTLDDEGVLCDFHAVEAALREVISPFVNANLHDSPPFNRRNPTAELVARHIADELAVRLAPSLARGARVSAVSVTEAPGCAATYRPEP